MFEGEMTEDEKLKYPRMILVLRCILFENYIYVLKVFFKMHITKFQNDQDTHNMFEHAQ